MSSSSPCPGPDRLAVHDRASLVGLPKFAPPTASLASAIENRTSARRFADEGLVLNELASVLFGMYGMAETVAHPFGFRERPVPSAGAVYALSLIVNSRSTKGLPDALYRYDPAGHALQEVAPPVDAEALSGVLMAQSYAVKAPILVTVAAERERAIERYGFRGHRYLLIEAGHVAQNASLLAASYGLACLCIGGFDDAGLARLLRLDDPPVVPLYCIALGRLPDSLSRRGSRGFT